MLLGNRAFIEDLPTFLRRPRCPGLFLPYTSYCYRRQILIPSHFHLTALFWWSLALVVTRKTRYKFFTSLVVWACRLVFLLGVILKRFKKLGFYFLVLFGLDIFDIQPNFIIARIASRLDAFIISLLLKLLSVLGVFVANGHQLL